MVKLIPLSNVFLSFIPVILLIGILFIITKDVKRIIIATIRMLIQLIAIGYVLSTLFNQDHNLITALVITFMLVMASIISMSSSYEKSKNIYLYCLYSFVLGALPILLFMTYFVIPSNNWFMASFIIPLAGMIFSQAMNVVALATERFQNEIKNKKSPQEAQEIALKAALIPITNTFMAVGIVSLPGLMTGQILAGVDPLIAVRYQIIIMTMVFSSVSATTLWMLKFLNHQITKENYSKEF